MLNLIGFLVFASVLALGVYVDSSRQGATSALAAMFGGGTLPRPGAVRKLPREERAKRLLKGWLGRFRGLADSLGGGGLDDVKKKLLWAGSPLGLEPEEFFAMKIALAAGLPALVSLTAFAGAGTFALLLAAVSAGAGYALPEFWLSSRVSKRQRAAEVELIPFIDLLAVTCEAGLSLNEAVRRVTAAREGVVSEEFRRAWREVDASVPRAQAVQAIAERTGSEEVRMLTNSIVNAEKYGTPVAQVLRAQASQLRAQRRNRAHEIAQKASVKVIFPIMVFMIMPLMVILLYPAVVNFVRAMGF